MTEQKCNLYLYSKCSTCQKALRFIEAFNVPFAVKEITLEPPSLEELKNMYQFQRENIKKLFNTSGMLYREMQLSKKIDKLSLDEAFAFLTQNGMLVKRPFLIGSAFGLTGFNEKEWQKSFAEKA